MTAFAELDLVARTEQLEAAVREIRKIGDAGERTEQRVSRSTSAMGVGFGRLARMIASAGVAITGALSVGAAFRGAQEVQAITNGFRGMGQTASEAAASLADVAAIADRTRSPLGATAELYRRVSVAAGELGANQQQIGLFTQNVGMALAASGTSAAQASGALLQLSQAMAGGVVRAEEFNSILEGAFPIAQAAARGIDEAGGSVGRLRQLVIEGRVSSEEFFNAILSQSSAIEQAFGDTVPTVSQAFTVLNNSVSLAAGQFDAAIGLSAGLAQAVLAMADGITWATQNTGLLTDGLYAMGAVAVGLAATQIPGLVAGLLAATSGLSLMAVQMYAGAAASVVMTGAMRALGIAIAFAGGPLGLVVGLIGAAAAAAYLFRDRISELISPTDDLTRAQNALTGAMAVFSEDAAPSSAAAAITAANAYRQQATAARDAAAAELARVSAMMAAQEEHGLDPEAALLLGDREAQSLVRLRAAQEALAAANRQADQAARLVTGTMSEGMMAAADATRTVRVEIENMSDALTLPSTGGGSRSSAATAYEDVAESADRANAASERWATNMAGHFDGLITAGKGASGVLQSMARQLESNGWQMLFRGLGGSLFGGGGGGGGFLSGLFAGFFDQGGMIPAGQVGLVGERGPEFVRGPAVVTSRAETARAMQSGGGGRVDVVLHVPEGVTVQQATQIAGNVAISVVSSGLRGNRDALPSQIDTISNRGM